MIGNLMALRTGKVKSHLKRNSWMHELQVDRDNCLKDDTSEAFLISLENKTFKGPVLVLESPIAKPFRQFTSLPLDSQIQSNTTFLKKTRSYNRQFNCLLTGNIRLHPSAVTRQTLEQPYPIGIEQVTPNAYQLIALCRCNMLYTSPPQLEGDTQPRETGISPSGNVSKATVQHKLGSLEKPHSPGI